MRIQLEQHILRFFSTQSWASVLLCYFLTTGCSKQAAPPAQPNSPAGKTAIAAANSGTNDMPATNTMTLLALFDDASENGRDPFFPTTARRAKPAAAEEKAAEPQMPAQPLVSYLKLNGVRPSKTRPMAIINKSIFSPGELGEVTIAVPKAAGTNEVLNLQVRCLEIRSQSVVICIEGEPGTKELFMADQP